MSWEQFNNNSNCEIHLDLSKVDIVRNCDIENLKNSDFVENELMPSLGVQYRNSA